MPETSAKLKRRWLLIVGILAAVGAAVWVFWPSVQTLRHALPLLRHAQFGWVGGAVLCQAAMYAALSQVLRAGLGAGDQNEPQTNKPARLSFWFLWTTGAAFLWASRALPGPALAGVATLTFLLHRRGIAAASAQAVATTFFLADYVSFFGLAVLLFGTLAAQNRLRGLHPGLLGVGMAIIVGGLALTFVALRVPDKAARGAKRVASGLARLTRRPDAAREKWENAAQQGVEGFYKRWQEITARKRTVVGAVLWATVMHLAEAATVFCVARAFGAAQTGGVIQLAQASGAGYVAGNLAAIVSFLPAGLGFFEGAMGTTLHYLGGLPANQATLATLLYRVLSVWLPLPFALNIARHAIQAAKEKKAQAQNEKH